MPSGKSIFDVIGSEPVRINAPPLQMAAPAAPAKSKPNWAGILADALAGAMGKPGMYAASMQQQRAAEQEDIRWSRRQQSELADYEKKQQIEQRYAVDPLLRQVSTWQGMSEGQRRAYKDMHPGQSDIVTVTLPGNRIYSGPRDGLAAALSGMGGGASAPPAAPVGGLTPLNGGPAVPPSGGFRW